MFDLLWLVLGGILADTNPSLRIPLDFAGGLHDRDLGFVRFGWRDYDTFTSRWTAPDPIGDRGGDPDWYGYCLDDPVNGVDPLGLMGAIQYAPQLNELGIWLSEQTADGSPSYGDLPEWYMDTVKDNVKQLRRTREEYYKNRRETTRPGSTPQKAEETPQSQSEWRGK